LLNLKKILSTSLLPNNIVLILSLTRFISPPIVKSIASGFLSLNDADLIILEPTPNNDKNLNTLSIESDIVFTSSSFEVGL